MVAYRGDVKFSRKGRAGSQGPRGVTARGHGHRAGSTARGSQALPLASASPQGSINPTFAALKSAALRVTTVMP